MVTDYLEVFAFGNLRYYGSVLRADLRLCVCVCEREGGRQCVLDVVFFFVGGLRCAKDFVENTRCRLPGRICVIDSRCFYTSLAHL